MNAQQYVEAKLSKSNMSKHIDRVFGNLAIAGIHRDSAVTSNVSPVIDSLLQRLEKKIGVGVTAGPKIKKTALLEKADTEKIKVSRQYTDSLLAGIDPATGDKLTRIKLMGTTAALHNQSTRVVYPIPGSKNLPEYV